MRRHYLAIIFAAIVGFVSIAPQALAIFSLGDAYKGINLLYINDETYYLARMKDILDGHGWASSPFIYEHKNQKPLMYPSGEYLYAFPAILFRLPLVNVLIMNKFLFPAILFFLVYLLLSQLTREPGTVYHKINAVAGGLFVTLGYDLIDYKNAWLFLTGRIQSAQFLLWTRQVHPVTEAILVFIFLLLLWLMINRRRRYLFLPAGLILGLTVGYFFSWSLSLAVAGVLVAVFLLKKEYAVLKDLLLTVGMGALTSAPYWYNIWRVFGSAGDSVKISMLNGMFFTRAPVFNKLLLAALFFFALCFLYEYREKRKTGEAVDRWWWFGLALLLGGLAAFNQQIVTGRVIWHYHFVQYTIPFSIVTAMIVLFNFFKPKLFQLWAGSVIVITAFSLTYGAAVATSYVYQLENFRSFQRYEAPLAWFNGRAAKDCVVLVREGEAERMNRLIPGFTACNVYVAQEISFGVASEDERVWHNFLVKLRINGVPSEEAEDYLKEHYAAVRGYFYRDWQDFYASGDEPWLVEKIEQIAAAYRGFVKKDFASELKKYRLDYVISDGPLDEKTRRSIDGLRPVDNLNGFYLYQIQTI